MNSKQMKKVGFIEVYMPINDFQNYEVCNYGNVRNKLTGHVLKHGIDKHGYCYVCNRKSEINSKFTSD